MKRCLCFVSFLLLAIGCAPKPNQPAPPKTIAQAAPVDPWTLTTLDASNPEPALLWNGLLGIRIGRDATGSQKGFFALEEYDTTGEEKIRTLNNPLQAEFKVDNQPLTPAQGTDYKQSLDMANGVLRTSWKQTVSGCDIAIDVQTLIHPTNRVIADQWTFTCDKKVTVNGVIPLAGVEALPKNTKPSFQDLEVPVTFKPSGMKSLARLRATGGADPMPSSVQLDGSTVRYHGVAQASRPASFERILSFGKSPNFLEIMRARGIALKMRAGWNEPDPIKGGFQDLVGECVNVWTERWKTDIEIDGPVEDQQAVRSFLFYLRSAVHPESVMSVSPMGLSNQQYNGHVFWDADLWVFPALALIAPEGAIQIAKYRVFTQQAARQNFLKWIKEGRPTATGNMPGTPQAGEWGPAAKFAWESSVSGKETVPGPSRFEDHITGSVAFAANRAAQLGLLGTEEAESMAHEASSFYVQRSENAGTNNRDRVIRGTMSPDENHVGDNDLYTNLLAYWCWWGGAWDGVLGGVPISYKLPRDKTTFLTYDNDTLKSYKQAAAVLAIYPLQYPPAEKEAKAMMDRFADKVTKNGPAMSDSIHALIWARLGEKEKAYETWHKSWQPFTNLPLMLFSEKRAKPVTYFTTGAAGCLQTVLYGFLGFRIDSEQVPGAAWSKKLQGDSWLSIKPNLPPAWKSVKFKNFKLLGQSYTLTATPTATTVAPGD